MAASLLGRRGADPPQGDNRQHNSNNDTAAAQQPNRGLAEAAFDFLASPMNHLFKRTAGSGANQNGEIGMFGSSAN